MRQMHTPLGVDMTNGNPGYTVRDYQRQRARYERLKAICYFVGYLLAAVGCGLFIAVMLLLPEVTPP